MDCKVQDLRAEAGVRLRWTDVAFAAVFYLVCVGVATWPRIAWFRSCLPSLFDPLEHLWLLRWYRACVLEGQSPIFCPEVHYPTGVPLGCFTPMHFQALLYIPLSLVISNDVLCYNLIWMLGMVTTGLGTFLLAWQQLRDRWCAGFAGMLAILSAPVMLHAAAQLELIYLGAFPFFLWTWIRLFEQPDRPRLAMAVGSYVVMSLCTAYYSVYSVFPAALYFLWKGAAQGRSGVWPWFRERGRWLLAFGGLVLPCLLIIFSNHIWAMRQGYTLPRSFAEFQNLSVPYWSYFCPSERHALAGVLPSSWYKASGLGHLIGECCSYLGVAALGLVAYAAVFRVRSRDTLYWWACLAMLVVLSGGAAWTIRGHQITLPGSWLKKHFPLFQMIRCATRFNLFVAVIAAVVAGSGLKGLLSHMSRPWMRLAVLTLLSVLTLAEMAMVPYWKTEIPPPPGCYAFMRRTAPGAGFVEAPQFGSTGSDLNSTCAYWQAFHRGRTTAGYCTPPNEKYDNLLTYNSPFFAESLAKPGFLDDPAETPLELGGTASLREYAWLYLTCHNLRFVVLHTDPGLVSSTYPVHRLKSELEVAKVYEDSRSVVFDRDRLAAPAHPLLITATGWRLAQGGGAARVADREAHLWIYNTDADRELRLTVDAQSLHRSRHVRLVFGERELARWEMRPEGYQSLASPSFLLPMGLHRLVLESDRVSRPHSQAEAATLCDLGPYSFRVTRVRLEPSTDLARR